MQTIIPEKMKAVVVEEKSQTLTVQQIPISYPGSEQVLIRMAAAPINPSDIGFARGSYSVQKGSQIIPGFEGSGTVVAAGPGFLPRLLLGKCVICSTA